MSSSGRCPQHQVQWLIAALLVGGAGQALLGLYQFIFRIGPDWFMIMGRFMRASGSFGQPNPYAGYLGLCLPVAASLALTTWQRLWPRYIESRQSPLLNPPYLWALFYTGATGLLGMALLASWSRGGWLGAATGLATVVFLRSRQAMAWGISGLLAFLLVILLGSTLPDWVPAPVVARLQDIPAYLGLTDVLSQPVTEENFAVMERLAHWVAALRMWESAPWFGVGPGNYATVYPVVRLPQWEEPLGHAHNIYLNALAETGLVGFGGYLLLWGAIILWLWRQYQRAIQRQAHWQAAFALGVLGVVGHLTVHNFFDNLFVQGMYLQIAFWLTALILAGHEEADV
ncbi:MAG: O-antigen ligase family protein [Caldilineaceae bacterium]